MKRPLSPASVSENGSPLTLELTHDDGMSSSTKKEKKLQSYTLCDVCNIQLNSPAQAQIHFNGKSHQKRLKQMSHGKGSGFYGGLLIRPLRLQDGTVGETTAGEVLFERTGVTEGPTGHSNPLLSSLPLAGRALPSHLDIKHFLTFRLNGTSPLNLFPNFNTMDPVQKAVISHTFGVPSQLKKKQFISCNICHLRFNSSNQAEAHYKGHKHARKLKAIEATKNKHKMAAVIREKTTNFPAILDVGRSEDPSCAAQQNGLLRLKDTEPDCSSLMLTPNSEESSSAGHGGSISSLDSPPVSEASESPLDITGVVAVLAQSQAGAALSESGASATSAPDSEKEEKRTKQHLYCPTCKVTVNSVSQLEAHNTGAKHKSVLEGHNSQVKRNRGKILSRTMHKSKRIGNKGSINIQNKAFNCNLCEIFVNSETQLKQHMNSRRHKDRLAGKPPKPKYTPFSKLHKNAALAAKLALQKELTKTLAARFLQNPLTTAAVCGMPGPLTLRPGATLFQTPFLGPALFRTPTGTLRAAPSPFIFAPY
ncbi:zinc finger protein 385C isoform X3 [Lissotriton helveticus]